VTDAFVTAIAPGSATRIHNEHYATHEEYAYAWADVLRAEGATTEITACRAGTPFANRLLVGRIFD